jgi:uncharacterized protein YndB with AHSA1/START domain
MPAMTNLSTLLGLTVRSVSTVEVDGLPARRAVLARSFPTTAEDLWDALTNPERLPRWFLPISGELKEGGSYQLEGNAGGTVERCDPPHSFRVTWIYGDGPTSWVTVTLTPDGDGATRMEFEHLGQVPEDMWVRYGPGATGVGWDLALSGLIRHLSTGEPLDPAAVEAWTVSPEGQEFVRGLAQAWQQADVAGGTAEADAAIRAERTVAFYTGQPEPPVD